jgi:hypothetical protein
MWLLQGGRVDFVVVGLGVGALAVLLGLIIRDSGGRWWSIRGDRALPPAEADRRLAIGRACRAGGLVLGVAGGVILAVTATALVLGFSDRVGAILVMAAVAATVLGGVAWALLYTHRHHPRPRSRMVSRRHGQGTERPEERPPSLAGTIDAGVALGADTPDVDTTEPGRADEPAIADEAPAPAPLAANPDPSDTDAAAIAEEPPAAADNSGGNPAAAGDDVATEAAPDPDPAAADDAPSNEPSDDAAPNRTTAYATSINRGT